MPELPYICLVLGPRALTLLRLKQRKSRRGNVDCKLRHLRTIQPTRIERTLLNAGFFPTVAEIFTNDLGSSFSRNADS